MINRYFIETNALDERVDIFEEEFKDEDDLNDYLDEGFHNLSHITILTEEQFKALKEKIKQLEVNREKWKNVNSVTKK